MACQYTGTLQTVTPKGYQPCKSAKWNSAFAIRSIRNIYCNCMNSFSSTKQAARGTAWNRNFLLSRRMLSDYRPSTLPAVSKWWPFNDITTLLHSVSKQGRKNISVRAILNHSNAFVYRHQVSCVKWFMPGCLCSKFLTQITSNSTLVHVSIQYLWWTISFIVVLNNIVTHVGYFSLLNEL